MDSIKARQTRGYRNYCRELAETAVTNLNRSRGTLDETRLVLCAFSIFFVNYFSDTLTYEAIDALRQSRLCKFHVKQLTARAEEMLHYMDKTMIQKFGEYADIMAQVNLDIEEEFTQSMDHLRKAIATAVKEHTDKEVTAKTRVALATMVLEFAAQNFKDRIAEGTPTSPIITVLKWIDHEQLRSTMTAIYEEIGVPKAVERDLTVGSVWMNIQRKWLDPQFIAAKVNFINATDIKTS